MAIAIMRLSDILARVLKGEVIKVPTDVGLCKLVRKELNEYFLANTTEPIEMAISPDSRYIRVRKIPKPLPISKMFNNLSVCQYFCFQKDVPNKHWADEACTSECRKCPDEAKHQCAGIRVCDFHFVEMGGIL